MNKIDSTHITNNPNWTLHWQMSNAERCVLPVILGHLKPALSLEIGTYQGGSLQVLSEYSKQVISVDIDPNVAQKLSGLFDNVEYRSGDSSLVLPELVNELNAAGRDVGFVLIDGDHTSEGVRRDIESILRLRINQRMVIIMHDGFNPECRKGMRLASWESNPHVHFVDLDFTVGNYHYAAFDTAESKSMWGGFACAILETEPRDGVLKIQERQKALFEAIYPHSSHAQRSSDNLAKREIRLGRRMIRRIGRLFLSN